MTPQAATCRASVRRCATGSVAIGVSAVRPPYLRNSFMRSIVVGIIGSPSLQFISVKWRLISSTVPENIVAEGSTAVELPACVFSLSEIGVVSAFLMRGHRMFRVLSINSFFGMRGKRSGIDGDSENRHSAVGTRYGHLIGKSRSGNGDGGNARILGGLRFMTVAAFVPAVFRHCLLSLRRSDVIQ